MTERDRLEVNARFCLPSAKAPTTPHGATVPTMSAELLTRWTIRVALALYVLAVSGQLLALARYPSWAASERWWSGTRLLWTAACAIFLLHLASAMHFYHGWSNQAAVEDTARQTAALFGWRFGEGIYFSYAFAVIWIVDVVWSWAAPGVYRQRGPWLTGSLHAYLFFIAFNGAVVFESGPTRPAGLLATGLLACLLIGGSILRRTRPTGALPTGTRLTDPRPAVPPFTEPQSANASAPGTGLPTSNGPTSNGPNAGAKDLLPAAPTPATGRRSDCR